MWHRAARLLALAALVAGIGVGAYTYYGPTGMQCSVTTSIGTDRSGSPGPPVTAPQECRTTRMADSDRSGSALLFLAVWSLAPALALIGSFGPQPASVTLASVAFLIELLSIIGAMSIGFLYSFIVLPLTGLALFAAVMPRRRGVG